MPKSILDIQKKFKDNNKELYVVGGAVRDFHLGRNPKDFDLCTNAYPDEILKILSGYKTKSVGKAFGVIIVYTDDTKEGMEIATFRTDLTKGRKPKVKLGVSLKEDANRRDLTINSLFYDIENDKTIDHFGGLDDLKNKVIKMVGDPFDRFEEDSLRILRVFRFKCRYEFSIDVKTSKAISSRNNLSNLHNGDEIPTRISQERIWDEMCKSYKQCNNYNSYLDLFNKYNMWGEVFPDTTINNERINTNNFLLLITNLFKNCEIGGLKKILIQKYKFNMKFASKVIFLLKILKFEYVMLLNIYRKKISLSISNSLITEWFKLNDVIDLKILNLVNYKPIVNSQDLIEVGFSGKELGEEIERLEIKNYKKENGLL